MKKYVLGIFLSYVFLFSCVAYLKYRAFLYNDIDLTGMMLVLSNMARGNWFSSSYGTATLFGGGHIPLTNSIFHLSFINFIFLPFYMLFTSSVFLLILQVLFIGSGIIGVYLIAKHVLGDKWALYIALLYAVYPAVNYINLYEAHYIAFSIPLLLFMFYFYLQSRYGLFVLFMCLSLSCREDVALAVLGMGAYLLLRSTKKNGPPLKWAATAFSITAVFISAFFWAEHSSKNALSCNPAMVNFSSASFYNWMGDSWREVFNNFSTRSGYIFENIFTAHKIKYLMQLFSPCLFICFLDVSFIMVLAGLPQVLLSSWQFHSDIHYQHASIVVPFIFISFIFGINKIINLRINILIKKAVFFFVVVIGVGLALYIGPLPMLLSGLADLRKAAFSDYSRIKESLVKLVPDEEPLISTFSLSNHLIKRSVLVPFHTFTYKKALAYIPKAQECTAAIVDFEDALTFHPVFYNAAKGLFKKCFFVQSKDWGLVQSINNIAVYRKGVSGGGGLVEILGLKPEFKDPANGDLRVLKYDVSKVVIAGFPCLKVSFDLLKNRNTDLDYLPGLQIVNKKCEEFRFYFIASHRLYPFRGYKDGQLVRTRANVFVPAGFRDPDARINLFFEKINH
ncbi:MAG: DUF2079 domain-containing protein [Candidatus Omnitrophica bacterium]|jgi:uncharacterized membrane protein|nr:DUF2079 domain-containing protein [Candidatus Omnitrophota bacterium]